MGTYTATLSTNRDTDIVLGIRHLGETEDLNANAIDFDSFTYLDLTANYYGIKNTKLTVAINNLMDT